MLRGKPAGIVALWEIPPLCKDDFTITYRLVTYDDSGAESSVSEVVMHPTEIPRAPNVTAKSGDRYRLCKLVVKPTKSTNPPPIPHTSKHMVTFVVRYRDAVLQEYDLEWHTYDWTRIKTVLEVAANGDQLVDLNREAHLTVVANKYHHHHAKGLDTQHVPHLVIYGKRAASDWKVGQENARDGHAKFPDVPKAYRITRMIINLDAVHLHNMRKSEARRKRMSAVIEIDPVDKLCVQLVCTKGITQ